jgi:hypothetical protein
VTTPKREWDGQVPGGTIPVMARPVGPLRDPRLQHVRLEPYTGSTKTHCHGCGCEAWVGPRSRTLIDSGQGVAICVECVALARAKGLIPAPALIDLGNPETPAAEGL